MQTIEDFWSGLEAQADRRWDAIAEKMRAAGYDPMLGAVLLMPTSFAGAMDGPFWVIPTIAHDVPMMTRYPVVDIEHLRHKYAEHDGSLLDLDALLGTLVTAVLKHAEAGGADDEAGNSEVQAIQAHVRRMITAEKGAAQAYQCTMGVGDGSGKLFMRGDYDSMKACQALLEQGGADRRRLDKLEEMALDSVIEMGVELDGGVHLTIFPVGENGRAYREKNTIRDAIDAELQGAPSQIVRPDEPMPAPPPAHTPERLLEIARATRLREHLFGVSPTDARDLLARFHRACLVPERVKPNVGDRIAFISHSSWPLATVTQHTPRGFAWKFDKPHSLGPRHGLIESGEEYELDRWVLIEPASGQPPGSIPAGLTALVPELPHGADKSKWVRIAWFRDEAMRQGRAEAFLRCDTMDEGAARSTMGMPLPRLRERGMTPNEALAVLQRKPYRPSMNESQALDAIIQHLAATC